MLLSNRSYELTPLNTSHLNLCISLDFCQIDLLGHIPYIFNAVFILIQTPVHRVIAMLILHV